MKACLSFTLVISFAKASFLGFFFGTGFLVGLLPWHRMSFGAQYAGAGGLDFLLPSLPFDLRISAMSSSSSSSSSGGVYSSPLALASFFFASSAFFFSAATLFASAFSGVNSSSECSSVFSQWNVSRTHSSCSQLKLAIVSLLPSTLSVMSCAFCSTMVSQTSTSLSTFLAMVSLETLNSFSVATRPASTYCRSGCSPDTTSFSGKSESSQTTSSTESIIFSFCRFVCFGFSFRKSFALSERAV
mmetsp:Transcript_45090/g.107164  ORF Transcript_45090/g.107164 Transcript_45090/m.107164 type:complete len:244 (-) Transcript_45090:385-1116(-)